MRRTLLLTTALLASSAAFSTPFGCGQDTDPQARLACFDQIADTIAQCRQQSDKLDRLLCYDSITQASQAHAPASRPSVADSPPTPTVPVNADNADNAFGFEAKALNQTPDKISATVVALTSDPYGKWTITLDNGQRWRQSESRRFKLKTDDLVVIKKGALGSFNLAKAGSNAITKVKRLQ
ncbi:hypothetical protein [Ferrimonas pelagia]|uniref:Uncharacterized protein n=1 Tax=Ferrimonas pelagia TaxID=1177826 RepID=A0ABP9F324_9GAMM